MTQWHIKYIYSGYSGYSGYRVECSFTRNATWMNISLDSSVHQHWICARCRNNSPWMTSALYNKCYGGWCSGDERSQGISSHCNGPDGMYRFITRMSIELKFNVVMNELIFTSKCFKSFDFVSHGIAYLCRISHISDSHKSFNIVIFFFNVSANCYYFLSRSRGPSGWCRYGRDSMCWHKLRGWLTPIWQKYSHKQNQYV